MKTFVIVISLCWAWFLPANAQAIDFTSPVPYGICGRNYAKVKSPVVFHVVLPLVQDDLPAKRINHDSRPLSSSGRPVFAWKRGAFEDVAYLGYFVVTQHIKGEAPTMVWHRATERALSGSFSEQYTRGLQKIEQLESIIEARLAYRKAQKHRMNIQVSWWASFFMNATEFILLVAAPGEPPVPGWRPQFNSFYDIDCASPPPSDALPGSSIQRCTTTALLENPTPA